MKSNRLLYNLPLRLAHFAGAILIVFLGLTGIRLAWFEKADLPLVLIDLIDDFAPAGPVMNYHLKAGHWLLLLGLFYLAYLFLSGDFRRYFSRSGAARYSLFRRLLYLLIIMTTAGSVLSGLLLYAGLFDPALILNIHRVSTCVLGVAVVIHLLTALFPLSRLNSILFGRKGLTNFRTTAFLMAVVIAALLGIGIQQNLDRSPILICSLQNRSVMIDGRESDIEWMGVNQITVPMWGGANFEGGATEVKIRSFHDRQLIYFLLQWDDPDRSYNRFLKKTGGGWVDVVSGNPGPAGETRYWEDQLALSFHKNPDGCLGSCHAGKGTSPWRHYTNGDTADVWFWKSVSSNPASQAQDGWWDATVDSSTGGMHYDNRAGGGDHSNLNFQWNQPYFFPRYHRNQSWIDIMANMHLPYEVRADSFAIGSKTPGVIVGPLVGDIADVRARARWQGGRWTLEIARFMTTGSKVDIVMKGELYLGIAPFSNARKDHAYHLRPIHLIIE